ncbi:MAG: alpha/beta hydrolase family protein [Thalassotalea sp.]
MRFIKHALLFITLTFHFNSVFANEVLDTLDKLAISEQAPKIYSNKLLDDGFKEIYFEGATYEGKQTRIFSFYKAPKGQGPFPAMVLVHGGGGSAFKEWVQKWNDAGFAAISIATEGQTGTLSGQKQPKWVKNEWGGPRRPGIYNDPKKPTNDQWMNQSVTATIQAHNLLRSFDEVKKDQIGIAGISWGGVITSTVMGFDQRFSFAIPIYGCGFLDTMKNKYGKGLSRPSHSYYREIWEPALRIAKFNKPTLWMTGLKENNFSLDAQANTYKLLPEKHYQSIQPKLKHSHKSGWAPKEQYEFAQSVIDNLTIPYFYEPKHLKDAISVKVKHVNNVSEKAQTTSTLYYTNDTGHTLDRVWQQMPVSIETSADHITLNSTLPKTATAWIFNIEHNGLIHSSEFFEHDK